jgi:prephenate dehydratase/chorismate mutase/prephenate dehydratase
VLEIFAKHDINLTRIGSIQSGAGNYTFFLDFIGSNKDEKVIASMEQIKKVTSSLRFMGCYKEVRVN